MWYIPYSLRGVLAAVDLTLQTLPHSPYMLHRNIKFKLEL
jgi:hypothetical protein